MSSALSLLQWHACREIDLKAGEVRQMFMSDPAGQQRVYERKRAQAAALVADPQSLPGDFVMAEAERTARAPIDVAVGILAAADQEDSVAPAIEAERVGGKRDVRAATSPEAVAEALSSALLAIEAAAQQEQ